MAMSHKSRGGPQSEYGALYNSKVEGRRLGLIYSHHYFHFINIFVFINFQIETRLNELLPTKDALL